MLRELLARVQEGATAVDEAVERLRDLPFEAVRDAARIDHHRAIRNGVPEVVYGEGKTAADIAEIMKVLERSGSGALATRVSEEKAAIITRELPDADYDDVSRTLILWPNEAAHAGATRGSVAVVCAGTSDLPVAAEAARTLQYLGHPVERVHDVGVAGLHRVLAVQEQLRVAEVVIAVAGMEGALPTVLAGLVECPIIAVPTSIGYGVASGGRTALHGMLSSCTSGLVVVNIDNGFGAAIAAARINRNRDE
jgi:NCAIR mutase (PurE)-related protein